MYLNQINIFYFQLLKGTLLSLRATRFLGSVAMPNQTLKASNVLVIPQII